jgi:hypothetical protein
MHEVCSYRLNSSVSLAGGIVAAKVKSWHLCRETMLASVSVRTDMPKTQPVLPEWNMQLLFHQITSPCSACRHYKGTCSVSEIAKHQSGEHGLLH